MGKFAKMFCSKSPLYNSPFKEDKEKTQSQSLIEGAGKATKQVGDNTWTNIGKGLNVATSAVKELTEDEEEEQVNV